MKAFVAIRYNRDRQGKKVGGATFGYLPNTDIQLPEGWEWARLGHLNGEIDTMDISGINRGEPIEETCRMMSAAAGLVF